MVEGVDNTRGPAEPSPSNGGLMIVLPGNVDGRPLTIDSVALRAAWSGDRPAAMVSPTPARRRAN
jgi:hypothetical protein